MISTIAEGEIISISDVQRFSDSFQKREIVLTNHGEYNNELKIDFYNAKIDLVNNLKVGDMVKVHINVFSRLAQKTGSYFNNVIGWKIEDSVDPNTSKNLKLSTTSVENSNEELPF
tara:strand:- start:33 stop:380 length:348 start_codon:yes stop_codon:yes gene_type:complete